MLRLAAACAVLLASTLAFAQEDAAPAGGGEEKQSHFTVEFAGGALVPRGEMQQSADGGLDIVGRVGWSHASGLGMVLNLEYALFRRDDPNATTPSSEDASLFSATAAPRFTLGKHLVRLWVAAGAGVVVEQSETSPAVNGAGGLDFNLFGSGGLSIGGGYTRSFSATMDYDYFSLNAGLVFTM